MARTTQGMGAAATTRDDAVPDAVADGAMKLTDPAELQRLVDAVTGHTPEFESEDLVLWYWRDMLCVMLEVRFGYLPRPWHRRIDQVNDADVLRTAIRAALTKIGRLEDLQL